jgi:hypothetical protein
VPGHTGHNCATNHIAKFKDILRFEVSEMYLPIIQWKVAGSIPDGVIGIFH